MPQKSFQALAGFGGAEKAVYYQDYLRPDLWVAMVWGIAFSGSLLQLINYGYTKAGQKNRIHRTPLRPNTNRRTDYPAPLLHHVPCLRHL